MSVFVQNSSRTMHGETRRVAPSSTGESRRPKSYRGLVWWGMALCLCGLVTSLPRAGWGADEATAPVPQWIWSSRDALKMDNPAVILRFRRVVQVTAVEEAILEVAADDVYRLFVNGADVGAGKNWQQFDRYDITRLLVNGTNVIGIQAHNDQAQAGLVARLRLREKDQKPRVIVTDAEWKQTTKYAEDWRLAQHDDSAWDKAVALGPLGKTAPWGDRVKPATAAAPLTFTAVTRPAGPFELIDGDRVVFLGDTLIERAQRDDYLETLFTILHPRRHVVFRNLGWSGDTPWGDSRAGFGTAVDGFEKMKRQVLELRPTVICIAYGAAASSDGMAGTTKFAEGLKRLVDTLAVAKATFLFVTPIPQEELGPPYPSAQPFNHVRGAYADVIRKLAQETRSPVVDLFASLSQPKRLPARLANAGGPMDAPLRLTDNGIHLTELGYWSTSVVAAEDLGWLDTQKLAKPVTQTGPSGRQLGVTGEGASLADVSWNDDGVRFRVTWPHLPIPAVPQKSGSVTAASPLRRVLQVRGLPAGRYGLTCEGKSIAEGTAEGWSAGLAIERGPDFEQAESVRQAIRAKNELFFHRFRPQNDTYLYGFRKHEQGQNAQEIPLFDPLISGWETKIAQARLPKELVYELKRLR